MRLSITKSKRGHYTVTVHVGSRAVWRQSLISSLPRAREVAAEAKRQIQVSLDAQEPWVSQ